MWICEVVVYSLVVSLVSWTLLSILADLNNAVVWMVSIRPLISKSSSSFTKLLMTVTSVNYKWYHCHFHFFSSPTRSIYLCHFSLSFGFSLLLTGMVKSTIWQIFFSFLLTITTSDRLAEIRWCVCVSKSQRVVWVIFQDWLRVVHILFFFCMVKFEHFAQFPVDNLPRPAMSGIRLFLW